MVADEVQSERLPIIQMDYMFLGRHGEDVEAESALMTILVAVDLETGYPFTMQVPRKGMEQGKYALENLELFLNKPGYDKCILQHDAEHAVGAVARALQRHVGARRLQARSVPVRSHQSQGAVESANAFLAGQIRALWADLRERYRGGSEAWFCASVQPQKQDRVKLHPCNSAQHLRKQGPPSFLRVFFAATLSWLLPVRCAFGAIACNVKHEQSTSELCRERQRSRVSERNPNGNLTTTPPYSAKTPTRSDTKCWQAQWIPRFCGVSRPVE